MDVRILETEEPIKDSDDRMEPDELWEECWFFGNLLVTRSKIFRSFSDPCTSSSCGAGIFAGNSYEEVFESIKKLPGDGDSPRFNLIKAPSMPTSMADGSIHDSETGEGGRRRGKPHGKAPASRLTRGPSLPTSLVKEEFQDEDVEFSMGKLIRQASMKHQDILPPRTRHVKNLTPSPGKSRQQSRMKPEMEKMRLEGLDGMRNQRSMNQLRTQQKRSSLLESKHSLDPNIISSIPGLQETKRTDQNKEKNMPSRPYHPDLWRSQSSIPPVPDWGGKKSEEDMKEQIKFWARAVASNVH